MQKMAPEIPLRDILAAIEHLERHADLPVLATACRAELENRAVNCVIVAELESGPVELHYYTEIETQIPGQPGYTGITIKLKCVKERIFADLKVPFVRKRMR
ncbi:MAG TPA: hypothetical protein VHU23_11695 [Rhizomicrobium sp.]|jgi:hypothetical protein|nr:hypothetical protein [Rhizomicrobium sp.]